VTEVTALEFDTPMGPVWPAAKYLAVCAWPDSLPQRTRLVKALLHASARAAGYRHPGPDARVLERRLIRATERLEKAFTAAEVAQLKGMPAELQFRGLRVQMPSRHAVGRRGNVSLKQLQALAANDWQAPADKRDLLLGDNDFRTRVWRRFLPALPYVIPLKLYVQDHPADLVALMRNPEWLLPALASSEHWAAELSNSCPADFIQLVRHQ